jgi:hypothetical protein
VRGEAGEREAEEGDRRRHARHCVRRNADEGMNVRGDKQGIAARQLEMQRARPRER